MKAYAIMKKITGRRGISNATWEEFRQYGMEVANGLPSSGRRLLNMDRGDKDGDKAKQRYHLFYNPELESDHGIIDFTTYSWIA